jgi:hypothetical protein
MRTNATVLRVSDAMMPVVCLQAVGRSTRADIDAVHPAYVRAYARRQPLIAISDARLAIHDAQQRKLLSEWSRETLALDRGCTLATIILLDNPLLRGALTALNWLTPPTIRQIAVADPAGAISCAQELAARHKLSMPESIWLQVRVWLDSGHEQAKTG